VAALRCGLDIAAWTDDGIWRCAHALDIRRDQAPVEGQPLPFDASRAHALYTTLFGEILDLVAGKHLLIVPSGPLTQLPFHVLVTAPPKSDYRSTAWLSRDHAITVLPAVSSLKALRRVARASMASLPMIGFGNPLLDGDQNHPRHGTYYKRQAQLARDRQRCPDLPQGNSSSMVVHRSGIGPVVTYGGLAELAHLKVLTPLPETADELCTVAGGLGADPGDVRLGGRASERKVKTLSASGELATYRIVHFATHGALAGQINALTEPGLILTPPKTASSEDDGYLSASEIAGLKLDADWVILSACNTAAGGQEEIGAAGTEALSGLARAFFYAHARALLVSHWQVNSDATVKLITTALSTMSQHGRAEALRQAMLALIDKGEARESHPSYWAPFVVVGEGAVR